jgi:hypothetical protein
MNFNLTEEQQMIVGHDARVRRERAVPPRGGSERTGVLRRELV